MPELVLIHSLLQQNISDHQGRGAIGTRVLAVLSLGMRSCFLPPRQRWSDAGGCCTTVNPRLSSSLILSCLSLALYFFPFVFEAPGLPAFRVPMQTRSLCDDRSSFEGFDASATAVILRLLRV